MKFHDITVNATGQRVSACRQDASALVRGGVEVFRDLLERHGDDFEVVVPVDGLEYIRLLWIADETSALASFSVTDGPVLTMSAIVSSRSPTADRRVLDAVQSFVVKLLAGSSIEPAFDLVNVTERPAIITVPLLVEDLDEYGPYLALAADMETCLAAAFFESIQ